MTREPMRALSLWQPWAHLVGMGVKLIENRSWKPPPWLIGQRFAIHAAKKFCEDDKLTAYRLLRGDENIRLEKTDVTLGAIIATATLKCVISSYDPIAATRHLGLDQRRWFFGPYGWVLSDVYQFTTPIPCKGHQGLWKLDTWYD